jgi:hypothetical protein
MIGRHRFAWALLACGWIFGSATRPAAQGEFDVRAEHIAGMKLDHYYSEDRKHRSADFAWEFTKDGFTLKKGKGPIPDHLLGLLLPAGTAADEVTGKWTFVDGKLELTDIRADGKAGKEKVTVVVFRTAAKLVRMRAPTQHVFYLPD